MEYGAFLPVCIYWLVIQATASKCKSYTVLTTTTTTTNQNYNKILDPDWLSAAQFER